MPPHAPCRLQRESVPASAQPRLCLHTLRADCNRNARQNAPNTVPFASTRSVQIATQRDDVLIKGGTLCLHTLRADCNTLQAADDCQRKPLPPHAPCRLQRNPVIQRRFRRRLCLHTLRADCNSSPDESRERNRPFASTRSVQIATRTPTGWRGLSNFASTRSVQIATTPALYGYEIEAFASTRSVQIATRMPPPRRPPRRLCLHTLRADCNAQLSQQHPLAAVLCLHTLRADCNTGKLLPNTAYNGPLPPHAPCRLQRITNVTRLTLRTLPPHAPCRLQRQKCTECNMHFSERVLSR